MRIRLAVFGLLAVLSCAEQKQPGALAHCPRREYQPPAPVRGRLVVRVRNRVRVARPTGLCIALDGMLLNPESPDAAIADLEDHVDFSASLGGDRVQVISLTTALVGGDSLKGYRFKLESSHQVPPGVSDGMILVDLEEDSDPAPERRPTVRWTDQFEIGAARATGTAHAPQP